MWLFLVISSYINTRFNNITILFYSFGEKENGGKPFVLTVQIYMFWQYRFIMSKSIASFFAYNSAIASDDVKGVLENQRPMLLSHSFCMNSKWNAGMKMWKSVQKTKVNTKYSHVSITTMHYEQRCCMFYRGIPHLSRVSASKTANQNEANSLNWRRIGNKVNLSFH